MPYVGTPGLTQAYVDTLGKAVESGLSGKPTLFWPGGTVYTDGIAFSIWWEVNRWLSEFSRSSGGNSYVDRLIDLRGTSDTLSDDFYSDRGESGYTAEIYHNASVAPSVASAFSLWNGPSVGQPHNGAINIEASQLGARLWIRSLTGQARPLIQGDDGSGTIVYTVSPSGIVGHKGAATSALTSGALPTIAPVSGVAFQCSTSRDVELHVPVTFNPGVATTATCKVELSPDNVTFSTLATETLPVGTVFDGTVRDIRLQVPAGWQVKLTVTNATLGTGTYY